MIRADGHILFSDQELACKATGEVKLAADFADKLRALRLAFNRTMVVTSCCRSREHNARIGGHPRSLHVFEGNHGLDGTAAIDVDVDAADRPALVVLAIEHGWSVGVARGFLHLDRRDLTGLPQRIFGY